MTELTVTMIGDQPAVILPADLAARLNVSEGGKLQAVESAAGALISRCDSETAAQLDIALDVMDRRRDALRRLAE